MTTEVLTTENTCLWTSHVRNNTLPRCYKQFLAFKEIPARINKMSQSHVQATHQATFILQSV